MWFPFLIHTPPFISISPAFTGLPRRLSVSVGLRKMGLTQERNTFTAPFSFDVIRNSIPSKWVFGISQQSLKMSRDPLLSCATHSSSPQFRFLRSRWSADGGPSQLWLLLPFNNEYILFQQGTLSNICLHLKCLYKNKYKTFSNE